MEKKTFMRRPLDELIGMNYLLVNLTNRDLMIFQEVIRATNHEKKNLLWIKYLEQTRTGLT